MSLVLKDRVRETTTVLGTNDATLLGAVTGFQAFSVVGNGNTCYYTISDQSGGNWEVGIGTYSTVGPTLARTTILASSNSGSIVSFPAGTKDVFLTYPSEKAVFLDASGNLNIYSDGELRLNDSAGGEYVALKSPATLAASYTLTMPVDDGTNGQALITDGSGNLSWSTAASGDVYGPASATSTAVALFDGTTGKLLKNSGVTIDGSNNVSGVAQLNATTVDLTNLEVTNIKAKDGTQAIAIADTTGALTLSSGTANGVAYLNGSKVLTTGSALTFDGSNFSIVEANGSGAKSLLMQGGASAGDYGIISIANGATIKGRLVANASADEFRFDTAGGASTSYAWYLGASYTEQMRLTSTGLGIGTSSPASGVSSTQAVLEIANGNVAALSLNNTASRKYTIYSTVSGELSFYDVTAGAARLKLDSSGNLGLGVTPSAWNSGYKAFEISGSSITGALAMSTNATGIWTNAYVDTGGTTRYKINNYALQYTQNSSAAGEHRWYTAPSGTAGNAISFTQAMTLDASGNLGVGTSSPTAARLQIAGYNGGTTYPIRMTSSYSGVEWAFETGGSASSSSFLAFRDLGNSAERMRIDSSGNVGIGTSSPAGRLDVRGGSGATGVQSYFSTDTGYTAPAAANTAFSGGTKLVLWNDTATPQKLSVGMDANAVMWFANLGAQGGGASTSGGFNWYTSQSAGGTPNVSMRIDSSGNVGIGTSSPDAKLEVTVGDNGGINIEQTGANQTGYLTFRDSDGGLEGRVSYDHSNNAMRFATSNTERMRIDSSGNVGIGTTPGERLTVYAASNPAIQLGSTAGNMYIVNRTSNTTMEIFNAANGPMWFGTNNTERMRIDSSGNVGIGTSVNSVYDNVAAARPLVVQSSSSATTAGSSTNSITICNSDTTTNNLSQINFAAITGASTNQYSSAWIACQYGARTNGQYPTGQLIFATSTTLNNAPSEKMRIDSSGNVYVGTTSTPSGSNQGIAIQNNGVLVTSHNGTIAAYRYLFSAGTMEAFRVGSTDVGSISCSTSATAYNTSSDYRLKENIQPMQNALDVVAQLNPVTYTWKADGSDGQGFIAHELQEHAPYAVSGEKDGEQMQGVDYGKITPLLTAALQEAMEKIEQLEARIATLEAK